MMNSRIEILIQRKITDRIVPQESDELNHWKNQSSENKQILEEITKMWELSSEDKMDADVTSAWQLFKRRVLNRHLVDPEFNRF